MFNVAEIIGIGYRNRLIRVANYDLAPLPVRCVGSRTTCNNEYEKQVDHGRFHILFAGAGADLITVVDVFHRRWFRQRQRTPPIVTHNHRYLARRNIFTGRTSADKEADQQGSNEAKFYAHGYPLV